MDPGDQSWEDGRGPGSFAGAGGFRGAPCVGASEHRAQAAAGADAAPGPADCSALPGGGGYPRRFATSFPSPDLTGGLLLVHPAPTCACDPRVQAGLSPALFRGAISLVAGWCQSGLQPAASSLQRCSLLAVLSRRLGGTRIKIKFYKINMNLYIIYINKLYIIIRCK